MTVILYACRAPNSVCEADHVRWPTDWDGGGRSKIFDRYGNSVDHA